MTTGVGNENWDVSVKSCRPIIRRCWQMMVEKRRWTTGAGQAMSINRLTLANRSSVCEPRQERLEV